jgi:hypothetical protein
VGVANAVGALDAWWAILGFRLLLGYHGCHLRLDTYWAHMAFRLMK